MAEHIIENSAIIEKIIKLEEKYKAMGQDLSSYLDGLLHADYLTYWDYVHLDTLLSLQNPKTALPDELIFITYHQITELYFKLILHEIYQIIDHKELNLAEFEMRLTRICHYFQHLVNSFTIMSDSMEPQQFLKFRMSLLPASGFQSGQYRMIEILSTDFINLLSHQKREDMLGKSIEEQYPYIYWKQGATELATGKKTLTLRQFEKKYSTTFLKMANARIESNIHQVYLKNFKEHPENTKIKALMREFDELANVKWPLAHFKSAAKYLHKDPVDIAATGGTNWQKYLPPRFQRIVFYPDFWEKEELEQWGTATKV